MHHTLLLMAGLSVLAPGAIAEPIVFQQTAAAPRTVDPIPDKATAARLAGEGQGLSAATGERVGGSAQGHSR